ncbi:MAG TPA: cytochrome C oxidase subunit IV family protein [Woeseiaceae bacterium]|nr:cytochrome C oxidase subunit IV family protein [Woeseiaceae bacterium]
MEKQTVRSFVFVYLALIGLLALTVGSSFLELGRLNVFVNLAIAAIKAGLVAAFFMELRAAQAVVRLAALAGLFWLALLLGLSLADFLTR